MFFREGLEIGAMLVKLMVDYKNYQTLLEHFQKHLQKLVIKKQ
jgi:hypothetical protein